MNEFAESFKKNHEENPYRIETGFLYTKKDSIIGYYPMLKRSGTRTILDMSSEWLTYDEMVNHYIDEHLDGYTRKNMTKADRDDFDEKWLESEMFWVSMYGYQLVENPVCEIETTADSVRFVVNFLKSVYDRLKDLEATPEYTNPSPQQQLTRMERYYATGSEEHSTEQDKLTEDGCRYYMKYLRKNKRNVGMTDKEIIRVGYK